METFYTAQMLREKGASCPQVDIFKEKWPDGADLTEANLVRAAELELNLGWWAQRFLLASLWDEYWRQDALLWIKFQRQDALLWAKYRRQNALLLAEFKRQEALLLAEYRRQVALLIWRLICEDKPGQGGARKVKEAK